MNITIGQNHDDIAAAIATTLNAATNAFVATATNNKLLITATVSGTANEDRGPLSHTLQTLAIPATVATTTLLWAGDAEKAKAQLLQT